MGSTSKESCKDDSEELYVGLKIIQITVPAVDAEYYAGLIADNLLAICHE